MIHTLHRIAPALADLLRRGVTAALAVGMMMLAPGSQQFLIAQAQGETLVAAADFDALFSRLEAARQRFDRTTFDLEELAFELAFEPPEAIAAWVRDNIVFEQYPGLLRGAQGTLLSRAGNALDQAVFLATLLGDAGFETRIARGQLPSDQARALVLQMIDRRAAAVPPRAEAVAALVAFQQNLRDAAAVIDSGLPPESETALPLDAVATGSAEDAAELLALLDAAGAPLGHDATDLLGTEAQDYFWVQYRLAATEEWVDAHPAFADAAPPAGLEVSESYQDSIPAELQHRLRIDVVIEQKLGDNLEIHPLVDGWERPVANLNGVPLTFTNVPWSLGSWGELARPLEQVTENGVFVPLFNGHTVSGLAFDINGNVVPLAEANTAAADLFQTVGGAFEQAGGALDGFGGSDENPEDFVALTAQWIDYTLVAPGGASRTVRRTVLDRIGPEARAAGRAEVSSDRTEFLPLLTNRSALVATGTYPEAFALDRQLEIFAGNRSLLEEVLLQAAGYDPEAQFEMEGGTPVDALLPLELLQLFDLSTLSDDVIAYRAEPSLVVVGRGIVGSSDATRVEAYVDIVSNAKRIYAVDGDQFVADVDTAVRAGVWDTYVESVFLGRGEAEAERFNTMTHLDRARQQGQDLVLLRPEDAVGVRAAGFSAEAAGNIISDLEAGYLVLVPPADVTDAGRTAWWRVHPATGETLGVVSDGRGATTLEYLVVLGLVAVMGLMIWLHLEVEECKESIRGQAGYELELENPREYERRSLGCTYTLVLRGAVLAVDDEVTIAEERCRRSPVATFFGYCNE